MRRTTTVIAVVLLMAALVAMAGCPGGPSPEDGVRATFEAGLAYVKAGDYARVWTLYSPDFKAEITRRSEVHRATVKTELAKGSDWIQEWVYRQWNVGPEEFVKLSAAEMDAKANMVQRDAILAQKILGTISVDGEQASAKIMQPRTGSPALIGFILQGDRWLFHSRDYMPAK